MRRFALVWMLFAVACTEAGTEVPSGDAQAMDAADRGLPSSDGARSDAAPSDAAPPDAARTDAALPEAAPPDAAPPDAAPPDAAPPDAAPPDAEGEGDAASDGSNRDAAVDAELDALIDAARRCGDGRLDPGETCDDGPGNGGYGFCAADCSGPGARCGDGIVDDVFGEICDDGINDHLAGGCLPGCAEEDRTDEVFARDLLTIDIALDPMDWETLRHQRKTRHSIFGGADCRMHPVVNPYTWFAGTVTIDGVELPMTGLRKKGHFGSLSTTLPSLKLRFDHTHPDQRFHTLADLALNNSRGDASYLRSCLAYRVFAAAGIPAPRCTFAHVTVNGVDKGIYFAVEEVKKAFLRRHLPDDEGNLYEGTACDFRPGFFGGFEQETNEDTDPSRADLQAVYDVVQNTPDETLEAELDRVINLDHFFRFWAVESLIWHRDGYSGNSNNYFIYADPADGGRFRWLPWGPDGTFRPDDRANVPDSVLAVGAITHRLYQHPPTRDRYYAALDAVLAEAWQPEALAAEARRLQPILAPHLIPFRRNGHAGEVTRLIDTITQRRAVIDAARAGGPPRWTTGMRTLPCQIPVAPVSGTLETTWNTLNQNIFQAGTGTLDLTLDGAPIQVTRAGARIGRAGNGRGQAELTVETADRRRLRLTFTFTDPTYDDPYETPGPHELIVPQMSTPVIHEDISGANPVRLGTYDVGEGTWTFDAVGTQPGDRVSVRFEGTLYRPFE